jgi:hypothetical protein
MTRPEVIFVAATRGLLGAGIGLLISERLTREQRRGAGWLLASIGIVTTIPSAMLVLRRPAPRAARPAATPPTTRERATGYAGKR